MFAVVVVSGNVNLYNTVWFETVISVRMLDVEVTSKYPGRTFTLLLGTFARIYVIVWASRLRKDREVA